MSYILQAAAAADPDFQARIKQAILEHCNTIAAESKDVPRHAERAKFAARLLSMNVGGYASVFAYAIVLDDVTTTTSTDGDILARVASVFNSFIGY